MITLALDVSTKPGFAVFNETELISYGTLWSQETTEDLGIYPESYMRLADIVSDRVLSLIRTLPVNEPFSLVMEETTASSQNYSQKKLEWIHLRILQKVLNHAFTKRPVAPKVFYIRDGVWKRLVGANQTKEERNWNARIARYKKKNNKKIAKLSKVKGEKPKRVRKLGPKDYALRALRDIYGLELDIKQEDACDAILIGTAFLWNAPTCNGRDDGGILTDELKELLLKEKRPVTLSETLKKHEVRDGIPDFDREKDV